jgi:hypothetical protein
MKGGWPERSMYATTPKLKKSVEGSAKVQLRTSGAMKPIVPTKPVLTAVYCPCTISYGWLESIEWFIEDQAFCGRMIWLLNRHLPPLPSFFLSLPVCRRSSLLTGEGGEGVWEEPNNLTARKPGPL